MFNHLFVALLVPFFLSKVALGKYEPLQIPLASEPADLNTQFDNHHHEPGFDLDLDALRLVQFSLHDKPRWMTERQKLEAKALGRTFFDITDTPLLGLSSLDKPRFTYPTPNSSLVADILPILSTAEPKTNLAFLSSFRTRYYNSDTGKASSEWLLQKIRNYTEELGSEKQKELISVEPFKHTWKQTSIIIRIAPKTSVDSDPITILGAHCDSINQANPFLPAPGADDDGSGTMSLLEAYRALLVSGYIPVSPLEFHLYSAEEGGLLGSLAVAASYEAAGKVIRGMQQFDMTAWLKAGSREEIAILASETTPGLVEFQKKLVDRYLDIPWAEFRLPSGAGSDHMSWAKAGYPACCASEGVWENTNLENAHGPNDRIDISPEFSFDHMLQFSKLAVAFAVELSSY